MHSRCLYLHTFPLILPADEDDADEGNLPAVVVVRAAVDPGEPAEANRKTEEAVPSSSSSSSSPSSSATRGKRLTTRSLGE